MILFKKYNVLNLLVSLLCIISLLLDYCIFKEFYIESAFLIFAVFLLIVNIIRQIFPKIWNFKYLSFIVNLTIFITCFFNFYILAIEFFGYCFTGRDVQIIWILMLVSNILLFLITAKDIGKCYSHFMTRS